MLGVRCWEFDVSEKERRGMSTITANSKPIEAKLPCSIEEFLIAQNLLPRSVVVEHNGEAVAPSEFSRRRLQAGDRLEIVKIVAGG
jgi:thiamine biosynthesis protein ThiS